MIRGELQPVFFVQSDFDSIIGKLKQSLEYQRVA